MTLKIVKETGRRLTTIRLAGRIQAEDLDELRAQITSSPRAVLDLDEVTLVDVEVIRFLSATKREGIELRHCAPFIREWMAREQDREP